MFDFTDEELNDFLEEKPFYKSPRCFCLGNTLEDAGEIYRQLLKERDNIDVGMVDEGDTRGCSC